MKKIMLSSIVSMVALVALTMAPVSLCAAQAATLEGVWNSQVTLTNCNGGTLVVFNAFEMFSRGGSLTSTDNSPPTSHGPGLGRWQQLGGQNYTAPFQFFNFNADGSYAGFQKIRRTISLAADGNTYTSVVTFETHDPTGTVVFSGCGTETATRLQRALGRTDP